MRNRYLRYEKIKSFNDGITVNVNKPYIENFEESYEAIKIWCNNFSNCNFIKLYINNSTDYIRLDPLNNTLEILEMSIDSIKIEVDSNREEDTLVQVLLLR